MQDRLASNKVLLCQRALLQQYNVNMTKYVKIGQKYKININMTYKAYNI